jgi:sodium-dependent phosphate cotransporter
MNRNIKKIFWSLLFIISLYTFLLSINLLGEGLKLLGQGFTYKLIGLTANPILGLFVGLFTTAVVQSSSATTSIAVGMVASGTLNIFHAIPIIMGANIGTTVTNVLVSLTHITRKQEFQRAFPAATVHDFFNILTVLVVFPLELKFHILYRSSAFLANVFQGIGGVKIGSPLKVIVSPLSMQIVNLFSHKGIFVAIFALVVLFVALKFLVDAMRALITRRLEFIVDQYLFGRPLQAFLIGLVVTSIVQSSSVTTSLITPLVGAGILTVYKIFPYVVGANIGTTVTAILASLVTGNILAIQVAFAHLVFNIIGTAIWLPARIVPITLAKTLGKIASYNRFIAIAYIIVVFYLLPITIFIITKLR